MIDAKGRELIPDWFAERFYNSIKSDLEKNGFVEMGWRITKLSMIATLNFIRAKGYICQWIDKEDGEFLIKIKKKDDNLPTQ